MYISGTSAMAGWVDASIVLYVVALALGGVGVGVGGPKQARLLPSGLAGLGAPVSEALRGLLDDRVSRAGNYGSLLVVLAILVLMVFKL